MKMLYMLLCVWLVASTALSADVRVSFFDNDAQDGDSASYTVTVNNACTSCQGFGFRLRNSWESYSLTSAAPSKPYNIYLYDSGSCDGKTANYSDPWGDIKGTLADSVDSWKVCPQGKTP